MNLSIITPAQWSVAGGALVALIALVAWLRHRRGVQARIRRALRRISHDLLEDIYLPDGVGGHIHYDLLLLTNRGVVVLDLKDIPGTLFGADKMAEWVVMNGNRRHTFRNPLPGLHDRLAVLRTHVRDVHTEGYLVFTENGRFTKGKPPETLMLGELVDVIGPAGEEYPQAFAATWRELKSMTEKAAEDTRRPAA